MTNSEISLIGTAEAALELGVDESYVRRLCRNGRIEGAVQIDGKWYVPSPVRVTKAIRSRGRQAASTAPEAARLSDTSTGDMQPGIAIHVIDLSLIGPHPYPLRNRKES